GGPSKSLPQLERPESRAAARPMVTPITNPIATRLSEVTRCSPTSPDTARSQYERTITSGAASLAGRRPPVAHAICQIATKAVELIHPRRCFGLHRHRRRGGSPPGAGALGSVSAATGGAVVTDIDPPLDAQQRQFATKSIEKVQFCSTNGQRSHVPGKRCHERKSTLGQGLARDRARQEHNAGTSREPPRTAT